MNLWRFNDLLPSAEVKKIDTSEGYFDELLELRASYSSRSIEDSFRSYISPSIYINYLWY